MKKRISRRSFVAGAGLGAGSFMVLSPRVFGANDRVGIACVGVGGKGAGEVNDSAKAGFEVVALCDVDQSRGAKSFNKFPSADKYKDFRVMLEKQKDIDAVTVSTPDHTHAVAAVMAMKLGKHVYCQKPLTHDVYEARIMAQTAKEMKVATQMGNQAHAGEPIRRAVELIRAGMIGDVTEIHSMTNRPIWPQGMKERPPAQPVPATLDWDLWLSTAPERPYNKAYVPFSWRGWWDFGTGALGDMACHIIDMGYWAVREGEAPESVEAVSGGNTRESAPVWSTVTWQFGASGKKPPVKYVWYDGKKDGKPNEPAADVMEGEPGKKWDQVLIGTKGKMWFNRGNTKWIVKPEDRLREFENTPKTIRRVQSEDHEFLEACKGGPAALSNFAYAGPFSEMVLLGNVAIRSGGKVMWDAANLKATGADGAQDYIRREYRKGWSL